MQYGLSVTLGDFYGRKSTKDDGRSIAGQEADYRTDCAEQGDEIGRIFADQDRSASRYAKRSRPDYEALLAHIRAGECRKLYLWEASRGSRDLGDWVAFLELCRRYDTLIRVISHRQTYDVKIRRHWRTLAEEGIDSADESEKIAERTRRGKREAAEAGRPASRIAFGFQRRYDEKTGQFAEQVEHPDKAPIVREIVTELAAGVGAGRIARMLNARIEVLPEGFIGPPRHLALAPEGGLWTDRQVRQIAVKPSYAGLRVHKEEVIGSGCWRPVVDPIVWRTAQAILTAPGRKPNMNTRLAHWLTGAVQCSECRSMLRAVNRADKTPAYQCRTCFKVSASARALEGIIEPLVLNRLARIDAAKLFAPRSDDAAILAAIADEEALRERLADFRAEAAKPDGLSAAAVAEAERGLLPKIDAAAAKVRRLSLPPSLSHLATVDVVADWGDMSVSLRRDVVLASADVVLTPGATRGGPRFDMRRLSRSRWRNDTKTWEQRWQAEDVG